MVSTSGAVYSPSSSRCDRNSPISNLAFFGVMSVTMAEAVSSLIRNRFIPSGPNNRLVTVLSDGLTSDCSVVGVAAGSVVGMDGVGVGAWSSGVVVVVMVGWVLQIGRSSCKPRPGIVT